MPIRCFGSTTLQNEDKKVGLEPDECYYLRNESKVRGMKKQFDPTLYPPPDLAIEVDVTHRSIPRLPIYAALGVPEVWRYDGRITVLLLNSSGHYEPSAVSPNFPSVPLDQFQAFVDRMLGEEEQNAVIEEFRDWAKGLK